MGKTLQILDLYKEVDFHSMTVGYKTKEIYVFNPEKNSRMPEPGFFYTIDETKTWLKSDMKGIDGQPTSLAAHPTVKGVVAIGTDKGVFLSKDYGNNFEAIIPNINVTSISFDHNNGLLVGSTSLIRFNLLTNKTMDMNIPKLENDAIAYVKQNPVTKNEFMFATFNKDIYLTKDIGNSWTEIVDNGLAKSKQ